MASVSDRIAITRDTALYSLALHSMRREFDLSFSLRSQLLRLPKSAGLIFIFHYGKTIWESVEAVVVLADTECLGTYAFRGVTEHISAAQCIGWDLSGGYLFQGPRHLDERESRVKNSDRKSNNWIPRPEFGVSCLVRAMSRVRKRIRRWRTCRGFRHTSRSLHRVSVSSAPLIFRSFVKIYVSIDNLYA